MKAARPGIFTAVSWDGARICEALAIQMVVKICCSPALTTPAATLTFVLTMGIGNTVMGTVDNNKLGHWLWVLLLMSLASTVWTNS